MKNNKNNLQDDEKEGGRGYGYAAFCLAIAAAIFLPLIFVIGIYGLCGSALCALASLAFYNSQKQRGLFTLVKVAKIIAYVALVISVLILIGGIIYSAVV